MNKEKMLKLLNNKEQDIITTIEMVVSDSLIPDYYGNYDIYIDDRDGELYVFQTYSSTSHPSGDSLHFLHTVKSHAVKEGDFTDHLLEIGYIVDKRNEMQLMKKYRTEYNKWLEGKTKEVMWEVLNADITYKNILLEYTDIA